jgi:1,4-dihydroxy-2-naphthoate octaprenyltransferase
MAANILVIGALALVIGFLVASGRALYKWQGFWRWLALIPVAIMGFVVIRIVVQPEAHNLWPFEILLWCLSCALALAALAWVRRTYGAA